MKIASAFLLFLVMVLALEGGHAATAVPSPYARLPFVPTLVFDRNPPLCAQVLRDARARFRDVRIDTKVAEVDGGGIEWLAWERSEETPQSGDILYQLALDLEGPGQTSLILLRSAEHSWRGNNYTAFVAPSREAWQRAVREGGGWAAVLGAAEEASDQGGHGSMPVRRYYPSGQIVGGEPRPATGSTGDIWQPHRLFRWRGGVYFYDEPNAWGRMQSTHIGVHRLRAGGVVETQCRVRVSPDTDDLKRFEAMPALRTLLSTIRSIGSGGSGFCGTLNANVAHDGGARAAVFRASFRPWAISRSLQNPAYFKYDAAAEALMAIWSFEEAWNRREYQTYLQAVAPATRSMEQYLREAFGVDPQRAGSLARKAIEAIIGAHLLVPRSLQAQWQDRLADQSLGRALLEYDRAMLERSLTEKSAADLGEALHSAVEWPAGLVRLLDLGAEVDHRQNSQIGTGFGKTPLMTAAHMNRPDVVRVLLQRGADPNARTAESKTECGLTIERGHRTALMYAAENAGPEVMALLIAAGADVSARDTRNNGIGFYLASNPRLTDAEKSMTVEEYVRSKVPTAEPSFECRAATGRVERRICGDDVLAQMDRELASAFARWRTRAGGSAVEEQRAWLRRRDAACVSAKSERELGCLQQELRARVRYVHSRMDDAPAPAASASKP